MILVSVADRFQFETGVMRELELEESREGFDKRGMIASELRTIGIAPDEEMVVEPPEAAAAMMVSKSAMAAMARGLGFCGSKRILKEEKSDWASSFTGSKCKRI